ncbi:sulfide:quinone oxidoreductase [Ferrithrix thermotolerans DSM 19514]|uniref:Sulfide:quinone oxidoreductase n=1 Tax=Ferrithrix thermotolerans DSM 19514 TaxID=1121881 RepID=A0A1M4WMK5_9ACTN|nr:FAD-dependent oxidoreductase [Ferrithrix thermotolerans]SHE82479.1 sulfide:quinone oxidoreductase [Ferrithrix thermotolerans DSM 19514]
MNKKPRLVILGGGFAGLRLLYRLHRKFDITLVDPRSESLAKPMLPEVAFSGKPISHTRFPLAPIARRSGSHFVHASAVAVDPSSKSVRLSSGDSMNYDFLVIATGAVKDYGAIEGLEEFGYSVCDDLHAPRLFETISSFRGGPIVTGAALSTWGSKVAAPQLKAPCEGPIGEVIFMIHHEMASRNTPHTITAFTPGEVFFEDVGDSVHQALNPMLQTVGVEVLTQKVVTQVHKDAVKFADGTEIEAALAIVIPPYVGPKVVSDSGLGDEMGFLPVNEQMQSLEHENIFGAGDATALSMPKLGHIAVHQADIVAAGLRRAVGEDVAVPHYRPEIFCIMNQGGTDATLILSDVLFGGSRDIAKRGSIAHLMKWSFDSWSYHTRGHLPPDLLQEALEFALK